MLQVIALLEIADAAAFTEFESQALVIAHSDLCLHARRDTEQCIRDRR